MMGMKTIGDTSLGTSTALTRIGGAAGYMEVPAWADTLLGIWAHYSETTVTADEEGAAWGYLVSEDGMSIQPFEFLYPMVGCADATPAESNSTPGEYWPCNAPVRPLSRLIAYGQQLVALTAAPYAAVTYLFSNSRASGVWAPSYLDPIQGVQRYRKVGTYTAISSYADGFFREAAYQMNLGQGGGIITELIGVAQQSTAATAINGSGTFEFASNDVPLFPQRFCSNAYGSKLGATGSHDGSDIITRRPCYAEADNVVTLENGFLQGSVQTATSGDFITACEFVRG
jgi:hypothetical protein